MSVDLEVLVSSVACDDLWYAKITCDEIFAIVLAKDGLAKVFPMCGERST